MFAGLGAARIRRLFKQARENAPAIIFIDELDAVGRPRGSDISGERDQTLNQLLVEMDGFDARDNVIVMAASNMLEKLDKALLRPGGSTARSSCRRRTCEAASRSSVSTPAASRSPRTSTSTGSPATRPGSPAPTWPTSATRPRSSPGASRRDFIAQADFDNAFERVVAGLQSRKVITAHEKHVVAWHEAGHALVSELLPTVDKVQKVSIVPRGKALGYTLNLPQEDRYLKSREELIDYMKVLLAGRVSEQITFGRITTGPPTT